MQVRFCHNCGAQVAPNAKFCASCGTPVLQREAAQPQQEAAPAPPELVPQPEVPKAKPSTVLTLDSLQEPVPQPEPVRPVIFTLDSLSQQEAPAEPALPEEPAAVEQPPQEPDYSSAPTIVLTPDMAPQPHDPTPEPAQAQPEQSAPRKTKGILARRGFGRTLLAVLLCIVIFVWSFATLAVLNVRLALSGDQGEALMQSVLTAADTAQLPAGLLVSGSEGTLAQWAVAQITEHYQGRVDVSDQDLKEFLEDSSVMPFLAAELNDALADVLSGSDDAAVTAAEIEALLTADTAVISDIFGEELTAEDISLIAQAAVDSGALETLTAASLKEHSPLVYNVTRFGLSWVCIGVMGLILVLLFLLLNAVNRSILRTLGDTGITLMTVGAIWGAGGLLALLLPDVWAGLARLIRPVGVPIGQLLKLSLIPTAATFGTGVVLLLIKLIGKKIVTRSAAKQA